MNAAIDLSSYGFFGGAAPGVIYFLATALRIRRLQAGAQKLAREQGEYLDFDSSENQTFDFLVSRQKFIKPGDGPGVRSGKALLLSYRDEMWRRHWRVVVMLIVGVPVGLLLSTCAEYLMGRPW